MKSNKRLWALATAGALAISNLSMIATPLGGLTAFAEEADKTPHTITYEAGEGASGTLGTTSDVTVTNGNAQSFTAATISGVTKAGYHTDGYTTDGHIFSDNGYKNAASALTANNTYYADADATATVKWVADKYSVTINLNNSSTNPEPITKTYDQDITTAIADPTWEYHEFKGWKLSGGSGTETDIAKGQTAAQQSAAFDARHLVSKGDIIATADWEAKQYTITYDGNGATEAAPANQQYNVDTGTVTLSSMTREGYDLVGWSTLKNRKADSFDPSSSTDFNANDSISTATPKDYNFYAVWRGKEVKLTLNSNGGKPETDTQDFTVGKSGKIKSNPFIREGFTFIGWAETATGEKKYDDGDSITLSGAKTLYALWSANEATITFNANGGSGTMDPQIFTIGDTSAKFVANEFEKANYSFLGWNEDPKAKTAKFADNASIPATITKNTTVYAIWEAGSYTLVLDENGGDGTPKTKTETVAYDADFTLPHNTSEKNGYTFEGWALSNNAKEAKYTDEEVVSNLTDAGKKITLYKVWVRGESQDYEFSYDANGGEGTITSVVTASLPYTTVNEDDGRNAFKRFGYTLLGWSTNKDDVKPEYAFGSKISTVSSLDVTLYGIWKADEATIVFDPNNDEATGDMDNQTYVFGSEENLAKNQFKAENYTFAGWSLTADGKPKYDDGAKVDEKDIQKVGANWKLVLYAQWEGNDIAEAKEAAKEASDAADAASKAAKDAEAAAKKATNEVTQANVDAASKAAKDAEAAAKDAEDKAAKAEAAAKATSDADAKKLAENAAHDAKEAAQDAAKAAQAASKAATDGQAKIDKDEADKKAQEEEQKKSDGSSAGTPAPVGNELKNEKGEGTGFVVTNANASAPEVEYVGPTDKSATKADIPETQVDHSGNVYKVTSVAANAFEGSKVKTVTIRKNIKKIDPNAFKKSKVKNVKIKSVKLTKKMTKAFKKLKKGGKITVSGKHKAKNKELLNKLSNVKNGKTKVK